MIAIPLTAAIIMIGLLFLQHNHQNFILLKTKQNNYKQLSEELQKRLMEFDEYKKRVDTLTLKAGFKL